MGNVPREPGGQQGQYGLAQNSGQCAIRRAAVSRFICSVARNIKAAEANTNTITVIFESGSPSTNAQSQVSIAAFRVTWVGVLVVRGWSSLTMAGPMAVAQVGGRWLLRATTCRRPPTPTGSGWTKRAISPDGDIGENQIEVRRRAPTPPSPRSMSPVRGLWG